MIRTPTPDDIPAVFRLVLELAEYERLSHEVVGSADDLSRNVFETQTCQLIVTEIDGEVIGYAIFFPNFSTFRMQPGLYLEDIYVTPAYRGRGHGKAMLLYLIELAHEAGYGRVEWAVLDWNQPAIDFYQSIGADILSEWRHCRISLPGTGSTNA